MRKRLLLFVLYWLGMHVFANKYFTVNDATKTEIAESLFFEPFSWFWALLFFVVSFISLSKLMFICLIGLVAKQELLSYSGMLVVSIVLYRQAAIIVLLVAIVYAFLEGNDYKKKIGRYRGRERT
ncbi:hypothetical protein SAMN05421736_1047 [Evansella caseinilytica]|uniref:Uncharacterized protein n=1 Tax=Evansella caseinilytica TaxID=1503961 RepID=A0A1H3NAI1_9BACI|nr:hypothetical protein [Evansella caseinilytica]SDY85902.1 hypothetical protein SAMN05421736_1047 [Evansella caseinilytica]